MARRRKPVPNFTPIGATCRPCGAKNLKIGLLSKLNTRRLALRAMLPVKNKPGLVVSYDIRPGNGAGLFWFRNFINLSLTYLDTYPLTAQHPHAALIFNKQHKQTSSRISQNAHKSVTKLHKLKNEAQNKFT